MSQAQQILDHMERGEAITPLDALRLYGCFRLAARVADLRDSGHTIDRQLIRKDGKTYAEYRLGEAQ